jgi:hypothetical protein
MMRRSWRSLAGRGRAWVCSIRCLPSLRPCEYLNGWLRSCLVIISEHDFMWRERHANGQKPSEAAARRYLQLVSRKRAAAAAAHSVITFFTYLTFKTCNEKCTKYINCTRVAVAANAQRWKTPRDAAPPLHNCWCREPANYLYLSRREEMQ